MHGCALRDSGQCLLCKMHQGSFQRDLTEMFYGWTRTLRRGRCCISRGRGTAGGGRGTAGGGRHWGRPSEKSHCLDFCHKPWEYLISFISGVFIIIQISFSINWSGISEAIMQKLKTSQMRWIIHEGQLHFIPGVLPNLSPTPRLLQMTAFPPSLPPSRAVSLPSSPRSLRGAGSPGRCDTAAGR